MLLHVRRTLQQDQERVNMRQKKARNAVQWQSTFSIRHLPSAMHGYGTHKLDSGSLMPQIFGCSSGHVPRCNERQLLQRMHVCLAMALHICNLMPGGLAWYRNLHQLERSQHNDCRCWNALLDAGPFCNASA